MASPHGSAPVSINGLPAEPHEYDFFAAVRLLQRLNPSYRRIGYSSRPDQDPVRFAQSPALEFAPAILESLKPRNSDQVPVLYSRHFGLFGPNGPLPLCLTEYARNRILHQGDSSFVAFCNIFHHRLLSFFFRAWADAQKTVDSERSEEASWPQFIGSLVGMGLESFEQCDSVPDDAKFYYAGRLVQQNRNAEGLGAIIQGYFGVPTVVLTFVGRWLDLPPESVCHFSGNPEARQLGVTLIVGVKVWNCQMHFRLRMGPMSLAAFERLLPGGSSFQRLRDWVRFYTNGEFTWDAQMVLAKEEVPQTKLGQYGRLGWTTWLKTQAFTKDSEDLIFSGEYEITN